MIRKLMKKDAPFMYEWMHDETVVKNLATDFAQKTMDDVNEFIENSFNGNNIHMAIVDETDEYIGTVSLKNIQKELNAEFAITIRTKGMGKGFSISGMRDIINYGFNKLNLKTIYWCVSERNKRAVRFYDKNCFERTTFNNLGVVTPYSKQQIEEFIWYKVDRN